VVDPFQLTIDIAGNAAALTLPALLWAVLFLLAWEKGPFAESLGLGRKAFWLLLPGGLLATFAILPFAPVAGDWLAVSFAGALFPLLVGLLAVGRYAPPRGRSVAAYLVFLLLESAVLFQFVLPTGSSFVARVAATTSLSVPGATTLLVLLGGSTFTVVLVALAARSGNPSFRAVALLGGLSSGALVATFAGTAAIPGVGITEWFPYYLLPPVAAGLIAVAVAPWVFPGREGFALPTAFLATTFGVLLGADLLRQPPLYTGSGGALYTIGGAGLADLVYLSGLLALAAAYAGHLMAGRPTRSLDPAAREETPTPIGRLARGFRAGVRGQLADSVADSARSAREAAAQAQRLVGTGSPRDDRPWDGLPVPGWVVSDQANLDAVARSGTTDPREGFRAWLAARFLVVLGRELGFRRFATLRRRVAAFAIDLALLAAVAAVPFILLALTVPGDLAALLGNLGYNTAIYAVISGSFLYFVVAESVYGTTLGKWLLDLWVRDRRLERPGGLASMLRNVSNLPVLTVMALGLAIGIAFGSKVSASGGVTLEGVVWPAGLLSVLGVVAFVVGGIALLGAIGALGIALSPERQRIGDLWAGTWVIRAAGGPPSAPAAPTVPEGARFG